MWPFQSEQPPIEEYRRKPGRGTSLPRPTCDYRRKPGRDHSHMPALKVWRDRPPGSVPQRVVNLVFSCYRGCYLGNCARSGWPVLSPMPVQCWGCACSVCFALFAARGLSIQCMLLSFSTVCLWPTVSAVHFSESVAILTQDPEPALLVNCGSCSNIDVGVGLPKAALAKALVTQLGVFRANHFY